VRRSRPSGWALEFTDFSTTFQRYSYRPPENGQVAGHPDVENEPHPHGTSGNSLVNGVLKKGPNLRRRSLDEALDALQLLTVTDVCKLP
jgi:hypothetical protein